MDTADFAESVKPANSMNSQTPDVCPRMARVNGPNWLGLGLLSGRFNRTRYGIALDQLRSTAAGVPNRFDRERPKGPPYPS